MANAPDDGRWLDERSGALCFDDPSMCLGPDVRRAEFEHDPAHERFAVFVSNPPFRSYQTTVRLDGTAFGAVVFFDDEHLDRISLVLDDPEITGTSWTDYDPGRARAAHDRWLEARLGGGAEWQAEHYPFGGIEHDFRWGTVGSYLHPQDLSAAIMIAFKR